MQYVMSSYDRTNAVSSVAGLLTNPTLHANNERIEKLIHLLLSECQGKDVPSIATIQYWLNDFPEVSDLSSIELPLMDRFVSKISTPWGDFRIYEGMWEGNSFFLSIVLDTISTLPSQYNT